MKITKSNLKNAIKNILAESSGLSTQMEMDIESQVRKSQRTPGGLFLEVPNDPQIIQGTRNFLRDRFGMDIKNIVEDPDGEYYIFYQPNLKESKETKAKITKRQLRRIIKEELSPLERWSSMADSYGMQIRNQGSDYKMYNTRPDGSQRELELFIKLIRYLYDAEGMISSINISKKR